MRPPPLPPRPRKVGELIQPAAPFEPAQDVETTPGLGNDAAVLQLQRTLKRVRGERDDLRTELDRSSLPPRTRGQKAGKAALITGQWAVLLPVVALAGRALSKRYPEIGELVDAILGALGL